MIIAYLIFINKTDEVPPSHYVSKHGEEEMEKTIVIIYRLATLVLFSIGCVASSFIEICVLFRIAQVLAHPSQSPGMWVG